MNMIIPELKRLHSPDVEDIKDFRSIEGEKYGLLVQAFVGTKESEGFETFDFIVCSPEYLLEVLKSKDEVFLRHYLIINGFTYKKFENRMQRLVKSLSGKDWNEYANKLARYGKWEFEDYKD
jgi:hypothetical protein